MVVVPTELPDVVAACGKRTSTVDMVGKNAGWLASDRADGVADDSGVSTPTVKLSITSWVSPAVELASFGSARVTRWPCRAIDGPPDHFERALARRSLLVWSRP